MFSLRRPFTGVLQRRLSAQPLPARLSSTMSVAAVTSEEYEALTIPPIFDIFDAPVRLGESSALIGRTSTTIRVAAPERNGEKSPNFVSDLTRDQYSSLPPPIVFDGPARPAHLLPRALEHRRKMRQHLRSSPNRQTYRPASSFTSPSEIVCEVFDGPARITRYKYPTSSSEVLQVLLSKHIACLRYVTVSRRHCHMSA